MIGNDLYNIITERCVHLLLFFQIQLEKEKVVYELENVQSQLDKVIAQSARIQKEKETAQVDADRLRDKYEKVQVRNKYFYN